MIHFERRRLRFVATVGLAATFALAAPALATPSSDFAALLRDYHEAQLTLFPSNASQRNDKRYLGLYEDDLTLEHLARERRLNAAERARLSAIKRADLSREDRLSYDILGWTLATRAEEIAPGQGEVRQQLPLDQFNGAHLSFAREIEWRSHNPYATAADYNRAVSRMEGFAHWVATATQRMREGMRKGVVLPRIIVERIVAQVDQLTAGPPETNLFMGPTKNIPASIKGAERERIARAFAESVRGAVLPAYRNLGRFLKTEYLPKARASVGLAALPGGRALYLHDVRARTTLALTPDAIHALGLRELRGIEIQMEAAQNAAGFSGTLDQFRTYLHTDPRFKFANTASMLAAFEHARRTVATHIASQFGHLPRTRLEFRALEPFLGPSKSAAEYSPLSADGRRPGIVYINGYNLGSRPTYTTEALELHEGLPGHHLQVAIAVENASLPPFRRFGGPSAFIEGWAMYCETLGPALGLYAEPFQKFGALALDAWRTARLVADTGIHWQGWSAARATQYLIAHTMLSQTEAASETERYIAIPAQALAYKLGELKFLELEAHAEAALGAKFDRRRFHDAIVADGAMPLPILAAKMEQWIVDEKTR